MNANNIVERVKKLLLTPSEEWMVIKGETHTVAGLFTNYVMVLCAIPALASFIGWSVVGYGGLGPTNYRIPIAAGAANMVLSYILNVGAVYALALVIDALAPNFGGEKNFIQALKVAAFFPTAAWVAGVFYILPALVIFALVGALYSLWLLYTGLAPLMEVPEQNVNSYTTAVMVTAIVLMVIIAIVAGLAMPSTTRGF
jgi:hypothetical protein